MHVTAIEAFRDNYIWAIRADADAAHVAVVDPGDAAPVLAALERHGWTLSAILITHHHFDHVGGLQDLLAHADVPVFGPDNSDIRGISKVVRDGDHVRVPGTGHQLTVGTVPGHTLDHIFYYGHGAVFCGDTLFSAGCGRLFEGTPTQMYGSLSRLRELPDDTRVYCTHEYTLSNLAFADAVEPDNPAIDDYTEYATRLRRQDLPTLPSFMALEKRVNPFLRWQEPAVRDAAARFAGEPLNDDVAVLAALRRWKDEF
ncbi:MAG: hydroxyacylglutathione hydrolase [Pseudomonadota bacterium]